MNHLTEEQLVLYYYGEEGGEDAAAQHLAGCDACREHYGTLQRLLNVLDGVPVPERSPEYGAEVWRKVESQLPRSFGRRRSWRAALTPWRWVLVSASMAALLVTAFLAGRFYPAPAHRPAAV